MKLLNRFWRLSGKEPSKHMAYVQTAFMWWLSGAAFMVFVGTIPFHIWYMMAIPFAFSIFFGLYQYACDRRLGIVDAMYQQHVRFWRDRKSKIEVNDESSQKV